MTILNNINSVRFNGSDVTMIRLGGTTIWQSGDSGNDGDDGGDSGNSNLIYKPGQFRNNSEITEVVTIVNESHTDLISMFSGCYNLVSVNTQDWNTSNVIDMSSMFEYCYDLAELDLSNFNTSNVTTMSGMFDNCEKLTSLNLSSFDTSKVNNMSHMFRYCDSLTSLDVSNFDTSNVTTMNSMFYYCQSLVTLDLSSFDMANTTDFNSTGSMFYNCTALTNFTAPRNINSSIDFSYSPNLTHNSLMSIINNLAPTIYSNRLTLGEANLAKLTDIEKEVVTNKGWKLE